MAKYQAQYILTAVVFIEAEDEDAAWAVVESLTEEEILNCVVDTEFQDLVED